jgi:hypothetical protein
VVTPPGIGTPPPKRPPRAPYWARIGGSGRGSALVFCLAVIGCALFFVLMLWLASR